MAPNSASLINTTTAHSNTTTKPHDSEFCGPYGSIDVFETLDSSVPHFVNAALNVPMAIASTFANLLVILAMRHVTTIRLPSKLLLCSLVLTDLGAGLVAQPQFTVLLFMKATNLSHSCSGLLSSYYFTGTLISSASLLTLTAISLDRYTALFFYLRYQQIVTTRRVCAVLTFIWSFSLIFASSDLWNKALYNILWITVFSICFPTISVSYIKIYGRLRGQHGQQVQPQAQADQAQQQPAGSTLNMAKYKRTASTMMWIYVFFVICYLPNLCAGSIVQAVAHTALTQFIFELSYTVILLNSCLNPFFYCLRLPEIRTAVMKQLRQFCCRSPQQ